MATTNHKLIESIPGAEAIRERLAANYQEAAVLRRMLRLAEQRENAMHIKKGKRHGCARNSSR
jgi:hypothetical protein